MNGYMVRVSVSTGAVINCENVRRLLDEDAGESRGSLTCVDGGE